MVDHTCPRVLINLDRVSDIGTRTDDVFLQMTCDDAVRELCKEIGDGWPEELERLWKETENSYTPRPTPVSQPDPALKPAAGKLPRNPGLEAEVARIAKVVEEKMVVSDKSPSAEPTSSKAHEVKEKPKSAKEVQEEEENEGNLSRASIQPAASSSDGSEATSKGGQQGNILGGLSHDAGPPVEETPHYDDGQLSIPQTTDAETAKPAP